MKNKLKVFVFASMMLYYLNGVAQKQGQALLDSLLSDLPGLKDDTIKMKILTQISFVFRTIDPDKGIQYGEELLRLATQKNNKQYIAFGNLELGINYLSKSDFPKALAYELKAMEMFDAIGDKRNMAKPMSNIGIIYSNQGDQVRALEYYHKALKIFESFGMKLQTAISLGNIGLQYQYYGKTDSAMYCNQKALRLFREIGDLSGTARMLQNIGNLHDILYDYASSLNNKFAALDIYRQLGDMISRAKVYDNISFSYIACAKYGNQKTLPDSLKDRNKCIQKAEYYINKAIEINRVLGNLNDLKDSYLGLSNIYLEKKDYRNALDYYKQSIQLRDSIYSAENSRKIKDLEISKVIELKEKEVAVKNLQIETAKRSRYYIGGGMGFLLILSFIIYRGFIRQKHTGELLETEKKKSDDLLLNILPEEVATELKTSGHAKARYVENITVLYTDFVDFTGYSSSLPAVQLVEEIDYCFSAFDEICSGYKLEKIKTIGDAYMAAFGLHGTETSHAINCLKAATDINRFMNGTLDGYKRKPAFMLRTGLYSGPVVAGIVGNKKFAYDIWGETVINATQMERYCEPGRINMGETTFNYVKNDCACEYHGTLLSENNDEIKMYFVV